MNRQTSEHLDKILGNTKVDRSIVESLLETLKLFQSYGCPICFGDCASANPPVYRCPMQMANSAIIKAEVNEQWKP